MNAFLQRLSPDDNRPHSHAATGVIPHNAAGREFEPGPALAPRRGPSDPGFLLQQQPIRSEWPFAPAAPPGNADTLK